MRLRSVLLREVEILPAAGDRGRGRAGAAPAVPALAEAVHDGAVEVLLEDEPHAILVRRQVREQLRHRLNLTAQIYTDQFSHIILYLPASD